MLLPLLAAGMALIASAAALDASLPPGAVPPPKGFVAVNTAAGFVAAVADDNVAVIQLVDNLLVPAAAWPQQRITRGAPLLIRGFDAASVILDVSFASARVSLAAGVELRLQGLELRNARARSGFGVDLLDASGPGSRLVLANMAAFSFSCLPLDLLLSAVLATQRPAELGDSRPQVAGFGEPWCRTTPAIARCYNNTLFSEDTVVPISAQVLPGVYGSGGYYLMAYNLTLVCQEPVTRECGATQGYDRCVTSQRQSLYSEDDTWQRLQAAAQAAAPPLLLQPSPPRPEPPPLAPAAQARRHKWVLPVAASCGAVAGVLAVVLLSALAWRSCRSRRRNSADKRGAQEGAAQEGAPAGLNGPEGSGASDLERGLVDLVRAPANDRGAGDGAAVAQIEVVAPGAFAGIGQAVEPPLSGALASSSPTHRGGANSAAAAAGHAGTDTAAERAAPDVARSRAVRTHSEGGGPQVQAQAGQIAECHRATSAGHVPSASQQVAMFAPSPAPAPLVGPAAAVVSLDVKAIESSSGVAVGVSGGSGGRGATTSSLLASGSQLTSIRTVVSVGEVMIEPGGILGGGSFGKVFRGYWHGRPVAVKVLSYDSEFAEAVHNEATLSLALRHPNVVAALHWLQIGTDGVVREYGEAAAAAAVAALPDREKQPLGRGLGAGDQEWVRPPPPQSGASSECTGSARRVHGLDDSTSIQDAGGPRSRSGTAHSGMLSGKVMATAASAAEAAPQGVAQRVGSSSPGLAPRAGPEGLASGGAPDGAWRGGDSLGAMHGGAAGRRLAAPHPSLAQRLQESASSKGYLPPPTLTRTSNSGVVSLALSDMPQSYASEAAPVLEAAPRGPDQAAELGPGHEQGSGPASHPAGSTASLSSRAGASSGQRSCRAPLPAGSPFSTEEAVEASEPWRASPPPEGAQGGNPLARVLDSVLRAKPSSGLSPFASRPGATHGSALPQPAHAQPGASEPSALRSQGSCSTATASHGPIEVLWLAANTQSVGGSNHGFLVMELCEGGSLGALRRGLWRENGEVPDMSLLLQWALDIARGMAFIHAHGVCHGDLKLMNIMLSRSPAAATGPRPSQHPRTLSGGAPRHQLDGLQAAGRTPPQRRLGPPKLAAPAASGGSEEGQQARNSTYPADAGPAGTGPAGGMDHAEAAADAASLPSWRWVAKVGDFGLARVLGTDATHVSTRPHGTSSHLAPEVWAEGHLSQQADVYAYGMTLWELATGEKPWRGLRAGRILQAVMLRGSRPRLPPWLSPSYVAIVEACWAQNPRDRPTFAAVVEQLEAAAAAAARGSGCAAPHVKAGRSWGRDGEKGGGSAAVPEEPAVVAAAAAASGSPAPSRTSAAASAAAAELLARAAVIPTGHRR